jgi:hypothetical protein
MVEKRLLVKTTNKVKTEIYYLGHFAMQALDRTKLPDKDARQDEYQESITIRQDNRFRVRNNRQNITRTSSSNKQQESSASKKSSVTPSAKKSKLNPKPPLFTSDEDSSKYPTEAPSKDKDGALINGKSTSNDESKKPDDISSSDKESRNSNDSSSSDEESEKSDHSSPKLISLRDIMNVILPDSRSV